MTTRAIVEAKALWKHSVEFGQLKNLDEKDLVFKQKKVGSYRVELIGGKDRGAVITIWSPLKIYGIDFTELGINEYSRDKKLDKFCEIHFMHCGNADEEYLYLKKVTDLFDIIRRND